MPNIRQLSGLILKSFRVVMCDPRFPLAFQDYFNLDRCLLMGHSLGAGMCGMFASAFPERVDRLIMMDLITFSPLPVKKHARATRKSVQGRNSPNSNPDFIRISLPVSTARFLSTLLDIPDSWLK
jgi:pimeloyl-ACP methyl ester carboxylesterase